MKRYNATQVRRLWNIVIFAVLAIGVYMVWIIPGLNLKAESVGPKTYSSNSVTSGMVGKNDVLASQEMMAFITSCKQSPSEADPFLRSGEEEWKAFLGEIQARPPRLQGIITVQNKRMALINGSRYQTGDNVKGFTVRDVADTKVVLDKDGTYYTIHLTQ